GLACAFSPDGRVLASSDTVGRIVLWDVASATVRRIGQGHATETGPVAVAAVAWSPDGRWLFTAAHDATLKRHDAQLKGQSLTYRGHTDAVGACAVSPDGTLLVSASMDKTVRLWEVASGRELAVMTGHSNDVPGVAFVPDGERVVSASSDGTLRL